MNFVQTEHHISDQHGAPPESFLKTLVSWGKTADSSIFAQNDVPHDIYGVIAPNLARRDPVNGKFAWDDRRAAMMEVLRVLAGYESDWNWNEGVDTTNAHSLTHRIGQETGIFQVSFDSLYLDKTGNLHRCLELHDVHGIEDFLTKMKTDHMLALDYCATLLRYDVSWDGPILRGWVQGSVWRPAMQEFTELLKG